MSVTGPRHLERKASEAALPLAPGGLPTATGAPGEWTRRGRRLAAVASALVAAVIADSLAGALLRDALSFPLLLAVQLLLGAWAALLAAPLFRMGFGTSGTHDPVARLLATGAVAGLAHAALTLITAIAWPRWRESGATYLHVTSVALALAILVRRHGPMGVGPDAPRGIARCSAIALRLLLAAGAVSFAAWAWFGPDPRLLWAACATGALLAIGASSALPLAAPLAVRLGARRAAATGVLVRDAATLEALDRIDTVVVSKTGILTEGAPRLVSVLPRSAGDEGRLLSLAAAVESGPRGDPIAHAVVVAARARGLAGPKAQEIRRAPGKGVVGRVGGRRVAVGNRALLAELGVTESALAERAEELRQRGETTLYVAIDGRVEGLLGLDDPVRASTPRAIQRLHRERIRIVLLTGDARTAGQAVARKLGLDKVVAEVLPERKAEVIRALQAEGSTVAFAGDPGAEDAALRQAHIGIATGEGSEPATVSVRGDLDTITQAFRIGRATMRTVRQNVVAAVAPCGVGAAFAAGTLCPEAEMASTPLFALAFFALAIAGVVANTLRA